MHKTLAAFEEVWSFDFEFLGGDAGEQYDVVCLAARELRSGGHCGYGGTSSRPPRHTVPTTKFCSSVLPRMPSAVVISAWAGQCPRACSTWPRSTKTLSTALGPEDKRGLLHALAVEPQQVVPG